MPINELRGDATAREQITTVTVPSKTTGAIYGLTIDTIEASHRATAEDTVETIAAALASQLNAGSWTVTVSGAVITLTGAAGVPFGRNIQVRQLPASYVEELQEGRAPVVQVVTVTVPTGTTGGTWTLSANFGSGVETTSGLSPTITEAALATAIAGLATPGPGDVTVTQISASPRRYELRTGGALAGTSPVWSADGDSLTGHSKAVVTRLQKAGSQAPEIWALRIDLGDALRITIDGTTEDVTVSQLANEAFWTARGCTGVKIASTSVYGFQQYGGAEPRNYTLIVLATTTSKTIAFVSDLYGWRSSATKLQSRFAANDGGWQLVPSSLATRTVSFGGDTSTSYFNNWNLQARLESLPSIGAGNVEVITPFGSVPNSAPDIALIHFKGSLTNQAQPLVTISAGPAPQLVASGGPAAPEIQQLELYGTGGMFEIRYGSSGDFTPGITLTYDLATLRPIFAGELALEHQDSPTDGFRLDEPISSPGYRQLRITYGVEVSSPQLLQATGAALTGGGVVVAAVTTAAISGRNAIHRIQIDPTATGGTLRIKTGPSVWSYAIPVFASADDWQNGLSATYGANTIGVSRTLNTITIEFKGSWGFQPLPLTELNQDGLQATGAGVTVEDLQHASGPNHWNAPDNWTLKHVPEPGEHVVIGSGRVALLYGLTQAAPCTFSGGGIVTAAEYSIGQAVIVRAPDGVANPTNVSGWDLSGFLTAFETTLDAWLVSTSNTAAADRYRGAIAYFKELKFCPLVGELVWRFPAYNGITLQLEEATESGNFYLTWDDGTARGYIYAGDVTETNPISTSDEYAPTGWPQSFSMTYSATAIVPHYIIGQSRTNAGWLYHLARSRDGSAIFFADADDDFRVTVELEALQVYSRFTGSIGWPRRSSSGEWNEWPRYLRIDLQDPAGGRPNFEIGCGNGDSLQRGYFDFGESKLSGRIIKTQSAGNDPALQLLNDNLAESELFIISGFVGLALEATEHTALQRLIAYGGQVHAGNLDYQHLEDYGNCVRSVLTKAAANTVQTRLR